MPRSCSRSFNFHYNKGGSTYIVTARRITSGDKLNEPNGLGLGGAILAPYPCPPVRQLALTEPSRRETAVSVATSPHHLLKIKQAEIIGKLPAFTQQGH